MAVGVQSHWFSVGSLVSWGKSGVGVVATQSFINPAYGPNGLKMMESGRSATKTLQYLVAQDKGKDVRQVAMLDTNGNVFAFTGDNCVVYADQIIGDNFSVQANIKQRQEELEAAERLIKEEEERDAEEKKNSWKNLFKKTD